MKEKFDQVVKAWETGDVAALEKLLNEVQRQTPTLFKRLVSDRNQRWMTKVEELLRGNKNAMVVVGAGHLVGSDGLVELLRKKGFKVTQF